MSEVSLSRAARLRKALAALPRTEHRVFMLHAVDGMDYAAIAERLCITVVEVERLLAAALVLLDRHLGADVERSSLGNDT